MTIVLRALRADITTLAVDAIVNAANTTLLGGGGVDGAIHRAAGPELLGECETLGGCATGDATITRGYRLPARYVIHAVGPVWGSGEEEEKLGEAVRGSLRVAEELTLNSIAFPAISTGIFGFPKERAARVIFEAIEENFSEHPDSPLRQVRVTLFDETTVDIFAEVWDRLLGSEAT